MLDIKHYNIRKNDIDQILPFFDAVLDSYNAKKITKEYMMESCLYLHRRLPLWYINGRKNTVIENEER